MKENGTDNICGYFDPESQRNSNLPVLKLISVAFNFNYTAAQVGSCVNRFLTYNKGDSKISTIDQVTVTKWEGGKKSAFLFSFDDGNISQYAYAWPILQRFGELAAAGNEIGDYKMTHKDLTTLPVGDETTPGTVAYELEHSKQIIEEKIPGIKLPALAYSMGAYNSDVISVANRYYQSARTIGGYSGNSSVSGNGWYSLLAGNIVLNQTRSATDDLDKLNSYLDSLQNQTIPSSKWAIFLAHDIAPADSIFSGKVTDYYPVSTQ